MAFDILSPSAQVAQHLKELILPGQWQGRLPDTPTLSRETGIDRKTITPHTDGLASGVFGQE